MRCHLVFSSGGYSVNHNRTPFECFIESRSKLSMKQDIRFRNLFFSTVIHYQFVLHLFCRNKGFFTFFCLIISCRYFANMIYWKSAKRTELNSVLNFLKVFSKTRRTTNNLFDFVQVGIRALSQFLGFCFLIFFFSAPWLPAFH